MANSQKLLLKIVKTWDLKPEPEYRGFRCANCQKYMAKAWHHWLFTGGYKTPVHFCNKCENNFRSSKTETKNPEVRVAKGNFQYNIPQAIHNQLEKIAFRWNIKADPVYKAFICDNCQRKMGKAYYIWFSIGIILAEAHFCKNCGNKFGVPRIIRGAIYDLDGTLVSTVKLHEAGWLQAGKKFGVKFTKEMLQNQRGISDHVTALMMLPKEKEQLLDKFAAAKADYVMKNYKSAALFPGAAKVIDSFLRRGYSVWICTSAGKKFTQSVLNNLKQLKKAVGSNVVWREMYRKEKPSPDALNLTLAKMNLMSSQVCYIGDAFNDYKTSQKAKVRFIYFCPDGIKDKRIPETAASISSHKELIKLLA